jgi:hypothetical protein
MPSFSFAANVGGYSQIEEQRGAAIATRKALGCTRSPLGGDASTSDRTLRTTDTVHTILVPVGNYTSAGPFRVRANRLAACRACARLADPIPPQRRWRHRSCMDPATDRYRSAARSIASTP